MQATGAMSGIARTSNTGVAERRLRFVVDSRTRTVDSHPVPPGASTVAAA